MVHGNKGKKRKKVESAVVPAPVQKNKIDHFFRKKTSPAQPTTSALKTTQLPEVSTYGSTHQPKRPRGRPPSAPNKVKPVFSAPSTGTSSSNKKPALATSIVKSSRRTSSTKRHNPIYTTLPSAPSAKSSRKTSAGARLLAAKVAAPGRSDTQAGSQGISSGAGTVATMSKAQRPSTCEVTNQVLSALMVSDPINVPELCKRLVDTPREMIQGVLEVLQVLGVVMQLNRSDVAKPNAQANTGFYCLAGFARFPCSVLISELNATIQQKHEETKRTLARVAQLEQLAITMKGMEKETRNVALKAAMDEIQADNPQLQDDPLYCTISSQLDTLTGSTSGAVTSCKMDKNVATTGSSVAITTASSGSSESAGSFASNDPFPTTSVTISAGAGVDSEIRNSVRAAGDNTGKIHHDNGDNNTNGDDDDNHIDDTATAATATTAAAPTPVRDAMTIAQI